MTQVKSIGFTFLQMADLFSYHLFAQQVINFNNCLALQSFANDKVDYPVGGVREEVEIGRVPFGGGIFDEADVLFLRFSCATVFR